MMFGGVGVYGAQLAIPWAERTWEYPWILRHIPHAARTLLDFGPGPDSPLSLWLTCQGIRVTTADLRPPCTHVPGVDARVGDLATLDLPVRSFDVVTCVSVFEHLAVPSYGQPASEDRPLALLRRMATLVTPRGCILLTLPVGCTGYSSRIREDGYRVYTPNEMRQLVEGADLRVEKEDYVRIGRSGLWEPTDARVVVGLDSATQISSLAGFVLTV